LGAPISEEINKTEILLCNECDIVGDKQQTGHTSDYQLENRSVLPVWWCWMLAHMPGWCQMPRAIESK